MRLLGVRDVVRELCKATGQYCVLVVLPVDIEPEAFRLAAPMLAECPQFSQVLVDSVGVAMLPTQNVAQECFDAIAGPLYALMCGPDGWLDEKHGSEPDKITGITAFD